jgi:dephospho-CoA kinase
MTNTDPSKQNLSACMEMADYTFTNNGTLEDLYQQIEIVINEFRI